MDRYAYSRIYGLSFLFPNKKAGRRYPEIVLSTLPEYAEGVKQYFENRLEGIQAGADKYLCREADIVSRDAQRSFSFAAQQFFGVDSCVLIAEDGGAVNFHFPLVPSRVDELVFTLHVLLLAFDACSYEELEAPENIRQLVTMHTRVENDISAGWGHAMSGYVYPEMRRWLARVGSSGVEDPLKDVRTAMVAAARALDPALAKLFADMCRARVDSTGRFLLECAGNACDIAIYPDLDSGPEAEEPSHVGCHNLDSARQQLTLIAGLAALHDMAAKELS